MIDDHNWDQEAAHLIKVMWEGQADAAAQRRVLQYFMERLCEVHKNPFDPVNDRMTSFACGRKWVGEQIHRAIKIPSEHLTRKPHEREPTRIRTATERANDPTSRSIAARNNR